MLIFPLAESADQFRLAPHYTDHMVLQMEPLSAVIWGYADIGSDISLDFKGKVYTSMALPGNKHFITMVTLCFLVSVRKRNLCVSDGCNEQYVCSMCVMPSL